MGGGARVSWVDAQLSSGLMMWIRAAAGVALCALGGVWIAQGSGAMHGSMMTGHGRYTTLGLAVLIGLALIGWSLLVLRRTGRDKR
jgi:hypothetical protein